MELRRFRYMAVLAEELHFGRAAERLGIAQPALTQQIQTLEREMGVQLFQRTKRSVRLTVAGRVTLDEAIRTLQQADRTALVARQAGRGQLGHIEVGFVGSAVFSGVLSKAIFRFRQANPMVELRLSELGILQQLDDVGSRRLDIGIIRTPVKSLPPDVEIGKLHDEPIILALPAQHSLTRRKKVALEALSDEPFVGLQIHDGVGFNAQVAEMCAAGGLWPQVRQRAGQFVALAGMVAGGLGVAFVPDSLRHLQIPEVVYRPLDGVPERSTLAVVFRKSERAPAVTAFLDQMRKLVKAS
ncbi:MAG: LysR substrate-binding domain-containing protein [Bradyrhizobium sp.]